MTNEQFEALISKLEGEAQSNPGRYKFKVLLLAFLGNAYIGTMLLLIISLLAGLIASLSTFKAIALKLIFVVGFFLLMILRALWIKIAPPVGTEIKAKQAPELFKMVNTLRKQLDAPRFHHVLITDDFNAGVVQSPRLGIFGWPRNYLLIGLPLMKTLTIEQFKAVLAHEFGHLAKGHGRMSNWIYCQRLRWARLLAVLDMSESAGSFLFKPFLNWFVPYFNAYSFPIARANEYEADATSARLTSPQATAEALSSVSVVASYLSERFWPQIYKLADEQTQPAFAPYSGLSHHVTEELDQDSAQSWLSQAMALETNSFDTHPALKDRLSAIGEAPRIALPSLDQSADQLLADARDSITQNFDQRWKDNISPSWEQRHHEVQENRKRLASLDSQFETGAELTLQEAYDRAFLTETISYKPDDALTQFRALYRRAPEDAFICLTLGARLLSRDNSEGCALIEKAMQLDEVAIIEGTELLRNYHWRNQRKDEAKNWEKKRGDRSQLLEAASKERNRVLISDKFDPHELTEDMLNELKTQLKTVPGVRKAYFVRKRVKFLTHKPCYVLGYRASGFFQLHSTKRAIQVMQQIQDNVRFPGQTLIINVEGNNYRFGRKFKWMRGARIL